MQVSASLRPGSSSTVLRHLHITRVLYSIPHILAIPHGALSPKGDRCAPITTSFDTRFAPETDELGGSASYAEPERYPLRPLLLFLLE